MGGVWFITIGRGTSGRCMGNGMETRFVVAHDKVNGQWETQGSINMMN